MRERLEVAVYPFPDRDVLASLEDEVLAILDPPLNLEGRPRTRLRTQLSSLRADLARDQTTRSGAPSDPALPNVDSDRGAGAHERASRPDAPFDRPSTAAPFHARAHLQGLVGQTITTITGRPNTIVAVSGDSVFVRTGSPGDPPGEPVPIAWVQDAGDKLYASGVVTLKTDVAQFRSAFIGAVLLTLPGATGLRRPARVEFSASTADGEGVT
jgi:hypothetical protein